MKKYLLLLSFLSFGFYHSQQTEGLRLIREKYAPRFESILSRYKSVDIKKLTKKELEQLAVQKEQELYSLEFERNEEYLLELMNIKQNPSPSTFDSKTSPTAEENAEIPAKYPTGNDGFRREVGEKFYLGNIEAQGKISTELTFIIERDGSITEVKATGPDNEFNRQAQLAVYLTEHKWEPAKINGYPVRYRFRIPLHLNFD
ncbi:energy transducer TonB [Chryseobacterium hagamense]|uniref:TonB C-terminal domain-containing protein n=1 Tax=Chryseobacterium hagamense TaxID=395935 RepID=A0A511YRW4_9FLAO|nr:energy transducer TonB [Chryseobacterium hagamense]GEN77925.1 hypothetical protein CHA01nite_36650 [Chryseobacterium hagamense]